MAENSNSGATEELPDDWELELRVFHACGDHTPPDLRELLRDLWRAYCSMEVRAIDAEAAAQVADGYVPVPREATDAQLRAGATAWLSDPARRSSTLYRAMVAAATTGVAKGEQP